MWTQLSNIHTGSLETIIEYSSPSKASELNSWIRVFSGATNGNIQGLVLQSNTNTKLVRATGETTATLYGDSQSSGIVGIDWKGNPVESNSTRFLRPSPIITGFSSKEGQDQISRDATIQFKAFTLEQMEEIQRYFLEPGYSLFIEWGWNTEDGYRGYTNTNKGGAGKIDGIVKEIARKSLNFKDLIKEREKCNGQYDAFLGFIVGGNVTSEGDVFNIEVRLKGEPSLPTYLQGYRNSKQLTPDGNVVESTDKVDTLFSPEQIEDEEITDGTSLAKRRFRYMFNKLPSDKQLKKIVKLEDEVTFNQFINFDKAVENKIIDSIDNLVVSSTTEQEGLELKKEDLFSKNRYIRMDLAVKILNILGKRDTFIVGDKKVSFQIDIENTIIGGFPTMFSTNANKLIIPGKIPDFMQYFLEGGSVTQQKDGSLVKDNINEPGPFPPDIFDKGLDPFLGSNKIEGEYTEQAGYYGYLKYLFINFDVFKSNLNKKIVNSREVFISMLNELSSAVNAFWKFQIVEGEFKEKKDDFIEGIDDIESYIPVSSNGKKEGDIILTVIDENFVGEISDGFKENIVKFQHNGLKSVFLNANLDLSLPASMVGQIVNERLGTSVNPDAAIIRTNFFNSEPDLFINIRDTGTLTSESLSRPKQETELEKVQRQLQKYGSPTVPRGGGTTLAVENLETGEIVATVEKNLSSDDKIIPFNNSQEGQEYKTLKQQEKELIQQEKDQRQSNLQAYLDKLDIVPLSYNLGIKSGTRKIGALLAGSLGIIGAQLLDFASNPDKLTESNLTNDKFMKDRFVIHCFDDSDFFDLLKNHYIRGKYKDESNPKGLSTLIPIKYSFTILGNSGIRRGDVFRISGIPKKYSEKGIFQITEIEHTLEQGKWITQVSGLFRQIQ
jgi:hypothetical protein